MQFLSPALLYALAALAIPILLHLFYFRRFKKVEFSNVRFLQEIKEQTQNRSRLRNLVVLALRLLAFAALVMAFAQPFFGGNDAQLRREQEQVGLFVDNSFSMSAQASDVTLLEKAKQRAREIVQAYGEAASFYVTTNELNGNASRAMSQEDALGAIDQIELSSVSRPAASVVSRFAAIPTASTDGTRDVFFISDFQASQFESLREDIDSSLALNFVPIRAVVSQNVSIDSVWLASPVQLVGEPVELLVALTNHGNEDADAVRISARSAGSTQPFGTKSVPAYSTVVDTLRLSAQRPGWTDVTVDITDFPIEFDDRYHLSFEVRDRLKVLAIADADIRPYLRAAFPQNGALQLSAQRASNVSYSELDEYELLILDGLATIPSGLINAVGEYVSNGGKVLVFPKGGTALASYNQLLTRLGMGSFGEYQEGEYAVGSINTNSFVFGEVFERLPRNIKLPVVKSRYRGVARFGESLMDYRDGRPYLVARALGSGVTYVSTAGLDDSESDLVRNGEVFVPMLYRMALSGASSRPVAYTLGSDVVGSYNLPPRLSAEALRLNGQDGTSIPAQRRIGSQVLLSFKQAPLRSGFYSLEAAGDSTLARLAFNDDRRESPQAFLGEDALVAIGGTVFDGSAAGSLEAALTSANEGKQWWPYLIGLGLLALLAEALVIRFWQPNRIASPASGNGVQARPASA